MTRKRKNIRLTIQYQGTAYCGWQIQPGKPTVQETIRDAIKKITGETVTLNGSGRTDSGVHARGLVANFITESRLTPEEFLRALNGNLPFDIAVIASEKAPMKFHARFDAAGKSYVYTIYNAPVRPVFDREFMWHFMHKLDLRRMKLAAKYFTGKHDFKAFTGKDPRKPEERDYTRTITRLDITREGDKILFTVAADGFLYKMVRNIVGTLVEVGRGKYKPAQVKKMFEARDRRYSGPAAPAKGLCLMEVFY